MPPCQRPTIVRRCLDESGGTALGSFANYAVALIIINSQAVLPARTSSVIRCWNSGGYGLRNFPIVDSFLPKDRVSTKPGQLHLRPQN